MSDQSPEQRPAPAGMRASDEDRERLIADLNEHTVAGRLGTDELEERVQAVYAARTTAELDALRRDLPVTERQQAIEHAQRRSHLSRRMIQESGGAVICFAVCTGIWAAAGAGGFFWPVFVLIAAAITIGRTAWSLYGPAADLDAVERELDRRAHHGADPDRHDRHRQARHERRDERRDRRLGP